MSEKVVTDFDSIDWESWEARDRATLLFVVQDGHVLLIRKLRGLGAGKINAPGGRIDPGETAEEAAIREVHEETGIMPFTPRQLGELRFQFVDGYSIHVWVYRTRHFDGEPMETHEAEPRWTPIGEIPFDEMWEDDRYWLPMMVRGERFQTRWIFDGDRMVDYAIETDGRIDSWGEI